MWNLYSYNLHKATYHGLNNLPGRENKRNFIIGRGSFSGMHRFAALWTGDNASTWDFLRINVSQVLSLGMCGIAVCGQDIGGFEKELGLGTVGRSRTADALDRRGRVFALVPQSLHPQRPEALPGTLRLPERRSAQRSRRARKFYPMVLPVCRHYIERRYRLLQLFYDAMFENCLNGMPICRPLILTDAQDKALYNDKQTFLDNQFMLRKDLLIAPVLDRQSQNNAYGRRDVYLPAGHNWYCFMDNRLPLKSAVEGGTTVRGFERASTRQRAHRFLVAHVRAGRRNLPTIELSSTWASAIAAAGRIR